MKWKRFLADIATAPQVFVVGPMLQGTHHATGPTVYVDGGEQFRDTFDPAGNIPTISVGDGDSTATPLDKILPKQKDYSDLAFVLHNLPPTVRHLELLGFMGGRPDHQLVNFGEVHKFLKTKTARFTTVRFDETVVAFCGGGFDLELHQDFSVVAFESTPLVITGDCKYLVPKPYHLQAVSSVGLSNEGFGKVHFDSVGPCFIFLV